jgi:hypothetical protein
MIMQRTLRARVVGSVSAVALVAGLTVALTAGTAGAASPSDDRADFHSGNVVNCGQIGLPNDTLAFANGTNSIDDGNVSGVVVDGTTVNVDDPGAGVVIDAVVVKGGPAYNVYSTNSGSPAGNHVPPAEDLPTEYISPLNGGGNIPTVSHWFICYSGEAPPPDTGSLAVTKVVVPLDPTLTPVQTIPTSFTVHVECDDETTADLVLPTIDEGVPNYTGVVTGIEDGSICTVEETTVLPDGSVTTYDPTNVTTDGVEVVGGEQAAVTVTNNFTGVDVAPADVVKPPAAAAPVAVAPAFTG